MDDSTIKLQAKLDQTKSIKNINADVNRLQDKIVKLEIKTEIDPKAINKSKSLLQYLANGAKKLTSWLSSTVTFANVFKKTYEAIQTIKELDTALTDLKMTSQISDRQLEKIYQSANDTARQMGVTTKEIIQQTAAWSRLGFSTSEAAAKLAEYSSMFAAISPGMSLDTATKGLSSVMNAFKIGLKDTDAVVDGIISKINVIGSTQTISNSDIVDFLTRSSDAMAAANNTLDDTIALGAAMVGITGDAAEASQILNSVSTRLNGYDGDTGEFIGGIDQLSGKISNLTKTASTPDGISLFSDETNTQCKSTRQLLQEISEIYDQLGDREQIQLLETLTGGQDSQAIGAILGNFDTVTSSMQSMANSAGNAGAEMAVAMDSIEFKMNKIKETGTGIAQNLFGREEIKFVLDVIGSLGDGLDWLTDKLGLLGSIGLGAGLFTGIKNVGNPKMFGFSFA